MRPVSGYHLGMGVALGFAAALLLTKLQRRTLGATTVCSLLIILSCGSIYQNLLIQNDYAKSARYQAHFLSEARRLARDATPGDVILVPRGRLLETEYILSNSWGIVHSWMVAFEQTGPLINWMNIADARPVTVFLVPEDWEKQIVLEGADYILPTTEYTPPGFTQGKIPLVEGHVIVLEATWAEPFHRRSDPITVGAHQILLKKVPEFDAPELKRTVVGTYLFDNLVN